MTRLYGLSALTAVLVAAVVAMACVNVKFDPDGNASATPPAPLLASLGTSQTIDLAQAFTPVTIMIGPNSYSSGKLESITLGIGCNASNVSVTVAIHATSGGLPTGSPLSGGSTTVVETGSAANPSFVPAIFASPPTLTVGTQYAVVISGVGTNVCSVARTSGDKYGGNASANQGLLTPNGSPTPVPPFLFRGWVAQGFDLAITTIMNPF